MHVRDQWVFPVIVNAALLNAEHASQVSQVANLLQQGTSTCKSQSAVGSALKIPSVKEAFVVLAKMLSARKKQALSKKVFMSFLALLDDMNGNVYVGSFRLTLMGLEVLLERYDMCPVEVASNVQEEEQTSDPGVDSSLEILFELEKPMPIVGVNDSDKSAKAFSGSMERAVDDWTSQSLVISGVVITPGMNFAARRPKPAPEVAQLVEVYRNTTPMITHIIHRLLVKAG